MILWCRHNIALGFHVIPVAEGRNDVFSALLCHWETAPRIVTYDFACDLMQYSMAREPAFFRDTMFLIDRLHFRNHKECSEAFSLRSHMHAGAPLFLAYNDGSPEQGNRFLKLIRTSCLYMSLLHYVIYTRLFLEVLNRKHQLAMGNAKATRSSTAAVAAAVATPATPATQQEQQQSNQLAMPQLQREQSNEPAMQSQPVQQQQLTQAPFTASEMIKYIDQLVATELATQ
jgi:hypothetical protein